MDFLRSVASVAAGLAFIVASHLGTDQLLHVAGVLPPWGQPMDDQLAALAFAYRSVLTVIGCYLTARLAPVAPIDHALALGLIGTTLSAVGAIATRDLNLGPDWYPIALALTAMPLAWIGGKLHNRGH